MTMFLSCGDVPLKLILGLKLSFLSLSSFSLSILLLEVARLGFAYFPNFNILRALSSLSWKDRGEVDIKSELYYLFKTGVTGRFR